MICRPLYIPDEPTFIAAVNGALNLLQLPENWQQYVGVTPAEAAAAAAVMLGRFWGEACGGVLGLDVFYHIEGQGVAGGGVTANTNFKFPYNDADNNNDGFVSLMASNFVVQPGRYKIRFEHILRAASASLQKNWVAEGAGLAVIQQGITYNPPTNVQALHVAEYILNTSEQKTIMHAGRSSVTRATDALGVPANVTDMQECYGMATFERIGDF